MRYLLLLLFALPAVAPAQSPSDPYAVVTPVQTQLDGYNTGNLELFLSAYADSVKIYAYPDELQGQGKEAMRDTYGRMFERLPDLQCRLVSRMVMGNRVLDHESVRRTPGDAPLEVIAIYTVEGGLITEVRFMR
ncbi:nuclear transport factor 2 family protein [Lewinella sp. IMCC34183]|uniref:nuclear transport factor 2 family protein n=1 Tax=Lewinella sp. IMCC34183 TaxID=2248762 RepID=UPI000E23DC9F|nr:nuclear transport factor 2 family protein [Lewinella sp. IMCC34183]